jgi:hypothetical protein
MMSYLKDCYCFSCVAFRAERKNANAWVPPTDEERAMFRRHARKHRCRTGFCGWYWEAGIGDVHNMERQDSVIGIQSSIAESLAMDGL